MAQLYTRIDQNKPLRFSPLANEILEVNVHNISAVYLGEGEDRRTVRRYTTEPCRGGFLCPLCPMQDPLINMVPQKMRYDSRGNEQHFPRARKYGVLGYDHNAGEPRILVASKTAVRGMQDLLEEHEDITNYTFKIKFEKPAYSSTALARADTDIQLDGIDLDMLVDRMRQQFDKDYRTPRSSEELAMVIDPTTTKSDRDDMTPPPPREAEPVAAQPPIKKAAEPAPEPPQKAPEKPATSPEVEGVKREIIMLATQNSDKFTQMTEALQELGLDGLNDIPDETAQDALAAVKRVVGE